MGFSCKLVGSGRKERLIQEMFLFLNNPTYRISNEKCDSKSKGTLNDQVTKDSHFPSIAL